MRCLLSWFICCLLLFTGRVDAAEPLDWAFIGIWDRSMPQVEAACRESGIKASFFKGQAFNETQKEADAARYRIVFVLNLEAEQAPALTQLLQKARALNPEQRVIPLDARGSQMDLDKAGLLLKDEAVPAYWRPNGMLNVRRLIRYCMVKHCGQQGEIEPPVLIPDSGYYDPAREESFAEIGELIAFKRSKKRWIEEASVAVLVLQQSFWITHDLKVIDAQIEALEKHGLNVVPVFGDREAQVTKLVQAAKPTILIEDRHGAMWQSTALLKELNAPYLRPISMLATTNEEWLRDPRGLSHRDVGMFMALQESWGTIEPVVVGGLKENIQGFRLHEPIPDRIEAFAARAARWAALRRTSNADKKIALIYYNKGLGQDDLMRGSPTGGFLDAPESFMRFLPKMKEAGFTLKNTPADSKALIAAMKRGGRNIGPWAQGDLEKLVDESQPVLVPLHQYEEWFNTKLSESARKVMVEKFGPPPGRIMVVRRNGEPHIVLPKIEMGNLVLMPQPERGEKQDENLLHNRDVPPPHNYLAFYWWLDQQYHADAIVHWGTHGTLELMPGKEAGLSKDCWSDICAGHMPVVNLWITDNLGEATLSRRRSYAALVDHMPPPTLAAGLDEEFKNLHEDIHKYRTLEDGLLKEEYRKRISQQAREAKLHGAAGSAEAVLDDAAVTRLDEHLHNLFESRTPLRLHVLGEGPHEQEMVPYLAQILGEPLLDHLAATRGIHRAALEHKKEDRAAAAEFLRAALDGPPPADVRMTADLEKDLAFARDVRARLLDAGKEHAGLITALSGHYMEPGPGPDPIRNPATAPGGRNLYSLNPEEIPTRPAWETARKLVDELLRTRKPKKIAMDLNGMETMRDFGVMEGQILALLGVRPIWNQNNLVIDVELIPAEELKRPRVEVFIAMGGQYKENFPTRVALLDKAVRMAAAAPETENPVRDAVAATKERLLKRGYSGARADQYAAARIFGTKPGNMSGTNILYLVPRSGVWDKDDEITDVYTDSMSFVYTQDTWGEKVDGLYEEALQNTDTVLRVWASNMTSQLSNHHAYEYLGGLSMAVTKVTGKSPAAVISDVRDPSGARVRDFEEVLASNLKSELLNRRWLEGMKSHDYAGAGHISELVKNTFGWSVTRRGSITQETWNEVYDVLVKDKHNLKLPEWFERVSPHAMQEISATLIEAARKDLWQATPEQVRTLAEIYARSVNAHGDSGGLVSGGNTRMADFVNAKLTAPGDQEGAALAQEMRAKLQQSAEPPPTAVEKVSGTQISQPAAADKPQPPQPEGTVLQPAWNSFAWLIAAAAVLLMVAGFFKKAGSAS
ncbi:cobaltochelatase subunit CobN [Prosthecobacter vanneervenii]|uniref:Cobaltochelatase CobN n=1 Tax=Prosthecobacter vanneervenii TaxID=48466 RepID=A0A7W7Y6Z5_9BACT|nr:cobaltochelatase subunit CobN [Prosthecobacter vanneervenii]MBB5030749.1 cobaltochelatase CobN [Prosthecobacter vanneervenii]